MKRTFSERLAHSRVAVAFDKPTERLQPLLEGSLKGVPGPTGYRFQSGHPLAGQLSLLELGTLGGDPFAQSEGPLVMARLHSRITLALNERPECFQPLLEGVLQGVPGPTREGFQGRNALSSQLALFELDTPR